MLACDYCLKLLIYTEFANMLIINTLTNYYFPMQKMQVVDC
jgi:hypothetical protein